MSDDEEPSAQEGFVQAPEIRMQPVADYDRKVSASIRVCIHSIKSILAAIEREGDATRSIGRMDSHQLPQTLGPG